MYISVMLDMSAHRLKSTAVNNWFPFSEGKWTTTELFCNSATLPLRLFTNTCDVTDKHYRFSKLQNQPLKRDKKTVCLEFGYKYIYWANMKIWKLSLSPYVHNPQLYSRFCWGQLSWRIEVAIVFGCDGNSLAVCSEILSYLTIVCSW